ncbi:hypothetical protein DL762_003656 [Monosporascus cannonballus]|uniref:Uncharacterized protein n=1 Tax=Monosporascus cannonballus TaxID=155416 RepID=A0ABY0HEF4_9PEZI|nr:hypothetical protein DL762_003656 [Monosporascus cannonballus]
MAFLVATVAVRGSAAETLVGAALGAGVSLHVGAAGVDDELFLADLPEGGLEDGVADGGSGSKADGGRDGVHEGAGGRGATNPFTVLCDRGYAMPYAAALTKISEMAVTIMGIVYHEYDTRDSMNAPWGRISARPVAL